MTIAGRSSVEGGLSEAGSNQETIERTMVEEVADFLRQEKWKNLQVDRESQTITTTVTAIGSNVSLPLRVSVRPHDYIMVHAYSPVRVPEEKRVLAAEFLTRANMGFKTGHLGMDFGLGTVSYKASVNLIDVKLTAKMINRLACTCAKEMGRYFPGLMKIIYCDNMSPYEAVRQVDPRKARGPLPVVASAVAVQVPLTPGVTVQVLGDEQQGGEQARKRPRI